MNLTKNFTLEEMTYSATAKMYNIDNSADEHGIAKLKRLCEEILQPVRDRAGSAIIVTSGYRCQKLNSVVGGAKNSQHCSFEAADIKAANGKNNSLYNIILNMINRGEIKVGQLIKYTHKNDSNILWIHVSMPRANKKNNQLLHIIK